MTTKTKYLVIALLLLVLVTTSVGLSTWNIHYQAVIGDIAYDTATQSSILNSYVYFGATDDVNRAQANIQQNGSALYTYPIGYNTNSDGSVVFDGENYSTKREELFTYTYQSGKEYSPSVFVPSKDPSKEAIKGSQTYPANLFLDDSALDIGWGIEDVFTEIKWEYQYRLASVPFDTSHLEEDYKGNSDNYCEVNAVYYAENQITVYLSWKNGKGNHQGDGIRVDFVVDENGNESFTIRDKNNNELTAQEAKLELNSTTDFITIGVKGFRAYKFVRENCGWTTDIPTETGVWECRIIAKAANEEAYEYIINKDANLRTDDEKSLVEAIDLLNSNTENDVDYATQVTYAVMPAPVSKQNTVTGYNDGTEKLQAKRSGTTRGTMPLAEENQQTQTAADEYVFTLGTGDAAISGTSFVYKGQGYNIEITADFQPTEGAAAISINYAEEQEKDAKDIFSHEGITSIDDHVYSTYGFSSDPNYIVTDPAVHYTIIKQEVKLTGWSGLETTYNGEEQKVEPILENTHGEVTFSVSYQYQFSGGDVAKNAGIYTVTAELVDAVKDSGLSANYFLVNYYEEDGKEFRDTDFSATMTINKAPLTVTANNHEITYGDAFAHNGVTYGVKDGQEIKNGFIGTDNATNSLAGTLSIVSTTKGEIPGYDQLAAETRKVGNYTLIASGYEDIDEESGKPIYADDGKHNYTFTYVDGTLTVNQLVAEFSWSNLDPTYNGTAQKPVATVTNEPYDDDVSILVKGEETNANVKVDENGNMVTKTDGSFDLTATYTATANKLEGAQAGNYTLEGASGIEQDFVIKPLSISGATITLRDALTYSGKEQTRDFTTTITLAESTATLAESTDYLVTGHKATNAFTYKLTITGQGNYYQTKTSDWEILKKDLTVTADDVAVIYGNEITYTASYDGFVAGEDVGNLAGEIVYNSGYERYDDISNWDDTGNKGVYTIVASGYDNTSANDGFHNYNISYTNGTLTVERATITDISVVGYTGTYDGAQHDSATKSAVTVNNQTLSWTLGIDKVINVADSATYNYTVTAPNHYDAKGTFTVEITPASVKVVVDDQEITYGDAAPEYTVKYTGLFGSDSLGTTASCDYIKGNNAGTYTITLSENTNDNYVISNDSKTTATLTVKKAPNSLTSISIVGWTYGQEANSPSATAQFGDTITFTYSADGTNFSNEIPTNAGTYTLKATVAETTNYESAEATTTFTIAKAVVTSPAENTTKFEYTTQEQTYALTESDLYTISNNKRTIAGSQTVTVSLIDKGNYQWDNGTSDDLTFTFTIAKATVGTPVIQSKEYNGELQTADVPVRSYYTVIENNGGTNIGTYNVKLRLVDSANTKWASTPNADITLSFSITKITTIISDLVLDGWTYGEQANSPTATINHNTAITYTYSKDGVTYTSAVPSEPGTYYVKASVGETENYTAAEATKTFEISRIVVAKPAKDETKYVYDGTAKTYSLQTSTLYTITSDGLTQTNAGTYPITIALNDTDHYQWDDYSDAALVYNFVIEKASIASATITLSNHVNLVYTEEEQTVTVRMVVLNGKELTTNDYTVTGTSGTNAGTYTVTVTGQGNYTGTKTTTFTIAKLTISRPEANSTRFVYNGTEQVYSLSSIDEYTITGNKQTNAGEYKVVVELKDKQNCQWDNKTTENLEYDFIIEKGATAITNFTMSGWTYGETASTPSATTNFGTIVYTYYNSDETKLDSAPTNAGTYTVVASVEGTDNYTAASAGPVEFTIAKQEVEFTLDFVTGDVGTIDNGVYTWTYNGQPHTLVVTSSVSAVSLVLSKTITDVVWLGNKVSSIEANVTFADSTLANNFTIVDNTPVSLAVTPATISLKDGIISATYSTNAGLDVTAAGLGHITNLIAGTEYSMSIEYSSDGSIWKDETTLVGTTYKVKLEIVNNYVWNDASTYSDRTRYCYLKYKTAKVGDTWYTIEDAIANIGTSTITLAGDHTQYITTAFTELNDLPNTADFTNYAQKDEDGIKTYSINSGTLLVPYENSLDHYEHSNGADNTTSGTVYAALTIPQKTTINFNGSTLVIGAYIGSHGDITTYQCNRGVLVNDGTININSGSKMYAYGYVKSTLVTNADGTKDTVGWINIANGAELTEAMHVLDWVGGNSAYSMYQNCFPSNAWSIHSIASKTRIYSGSIYYGYLHTVVGGSSQEARPMIVGKATDNNCLFKPESTSTKNYIEKEAIPANLWTTKDVNNEGYKGLYDISGYHLLKGQKDILSLYGSYIDGTMLISIKYTLLLFPVNVNMSTSQSISLPFSYTDVYLKPGCTLKLSASDYVFMPGTKLVVEEGAKLIVSEGSDIAFIDYSTLENTIAKNTDQNQAFTEFIVDIDDALCIVNGTMDIAGAIGGKITTTTEGAIFDISSATSLNASFTTMTAEYGASQSTGKTFYYKGTCPSTSGIIINNGSFNTGTSYVSNGTEWYPSTMASTITYDLVGGTASASINPTLVWKDGLTAYNIATPTRTGYTFDGWYIDDHKVAVGEKYYGAITLVAQWTAKTGTVTYNAQNGTANTTQVVTYDGTYNLPEVTRTGYKFVGWFTAQTGGTNVTLNNIVQTEGNHTLYAQWEAKTYPITFHYNYDDISETRTITFGKAYDTVWFEPEREGYEFLGWFDENGIKVNSATIYNIDIATGQNLYADWKEMSGYVIASFYDGDTLLVTKNVGFGTDYSHSYSKTGYTVTGWEDEYGNTAVPQEGYTSEEVRVDIQATPITYTVQFVTGVEDLTVEDIPAAKYDKPFNLPDLVRTGYSLMWSVPTYNENQAVGTPVQNLTTVNGETVVITAVWTPKTYTVTFNANGGTCSITSDHAVYPNEVTLPTPTRTGYTFNGWYTAASGGNKVGGADETYTPTANITLYAQWAPISYTITVTTSNATVKVNGTEVSNNGTVSIQYGTQVTVEVTYSQTESQSTTIKGADGTTYTSPFSMPAQSVTINATSSAPSSGCIAAGTLITMADGSKKKIELLSNSDMILGFDHETGKLKAVPIAYLDCSAKEILTVIDMVIGDTNVKVINEHGFFDVDLKEYVIININNADDYLGHRFLKVYIDENGEEQQEIVTFTSYSVYQEETRWYSLVAAFTINHLANDILTISDNLIGLYDYFELDNEFKYDAVQKEQDILTYGLFVYDDWKEYLTIEQFYAFNCHYLKVSVGKGILTEDLIFYYINRYVNHDNAI